MSSEIQEPTPWINLDMLYDQTLYDFQYCFKMFALNKYLRGTIPWKRWGAIRDREQFAQRDLYPEIRRNRFESKLGTIVKVQEYNNFCAQLLFEERHHAAFFAILLEFAQEIVQTSDQSENYFSDNECIQLGHSIMLMTTNQTQGLNEFDQHIAKMIQRFPQQHPLITVYSTLDELLVKWGQQQNISEPGPRMKMYQYAGTRRDPSANSVFHKNFIQVLTDNNGTVPPYLATPKNNVLGQHTPAIFETVLFQDFVTHPEEFAHDFASLAKENYTKINEPSNLFRHIGIADNWVDPQGDFDPTSEFIYNMRAEIYTVLRVNDCLLGYPDFAIDITRAQGDRLKNFEVHATGSRHGFWNPKFVDFMGTREKRDWPRGVWLPTLVFEYLENLDEHYEELLSRKAGFEFIRTERLEIQKSKDPKNRVTFSDKVDVTTIPRKPSRSEQSKGADHKPAAHKSGDEKKDDTNLMLIVGSILAFFGIFVYADFN